jgi:hypothetical protein
MLQRSVFLVASPYLELRFCRITVDKSRLHSLASGEEFLRRTVYHDHDLCPEGKKICSDIVRMGLAVKNAARTASYSANTHRVYSFDRERVIQAGR